MTHHVQLWHEWGGVGKMMSADWVGFKKGFEKSIYLQFVSGLFFGSFRRMKQYIQWQILWKKESKYLRQKELVEYELRCSWISFFLQFQKKTQTPKSDEIWWNLMKIHDGIKFHQISSDFGFWIFVLKKNPLEYFSVWKVSNLFSKVFPKSLLLSSYYWLQIQSWTGYKTNTTSTQQMNQQSFYFGSRFNLEQAWKNKLSTKNTTTNTTETKTTPTYNHKTSTRNFF